MKRILQACLAAVALAGCAAKPPHPETFAFAVIGDAPYNAREEMDFDAMLGRIGAEPLAFVVHVGDFKAGGDSPCTDALYADAQGAPGRLAPRARPHARRQRLDGLPPRLQREDGSARAPGEAARAVLRRRLVARPRAPAAREAGGVRGARRRGLPVPRAAREPPLDQERRRLRDDPRRGQQRQPRLRRGQRRRAALPLGGQPRLARGRASPRRRRGPPRPRDRDAGEPVGVQPRQGLRRRSSRRWRWARGGSASPSSSCTATRTPTGPTAPSATAGGEIVENAVRLETFGSPVVGWVRVTVDPNDAKLFRIEPHAETPGGG